MTSYRRLLLCSCVVSSACFDEAGPMADDDAGETTSGGPTSTSASTATSTTDTSAGTMSASGASDGPASTGVDSASTTSLDESTSAVDGSSSGGGESGSTGTQERCVGEPLEVSWIEIETFAVAQNSQSIDGLDLDGDDIVDLVVGSYDEDLVDVYLGVGDGTFVAGDPISTTGPVLQVEVAAIADGVPDLFIRHYNDLTDVDQLVRWRGIGDGGFQLSTDLGTTVGWFSLGYVDAAAPLDIVYPFGVDYETHVRLGNALEQFAGPQIVPGLLGSAFTHDLTGDGYDELVLGGAGGIDLYVNAGDGTFADPQTAPAPLPVGAIGFGDVDMDGNVDMVTGTAGGGNTQAAVYLGDGNGALGDPITHLIPSYTGDVRVVDVDADGYDDPLMFGLGGGISFLHSNGDGTVADAEVTSIEDCLNREGVVLDDLNGDCIPDIITLCLDGNLVHVLQSSG